MERSSGIVVELGECACCASADPATPPLRVFQPRPLRQLNRRRAVFTSLLASGGALVAACGAPAAPTPAPTAPPKPTEPPAKPTAASQPTTAAAPAAAAPAAQPTTAPAAAQSTTAPASAAATSAPAATAARPGTALEKLDLAFCSQVLCVLPFEVARRRGLWEAEGLDVNLTYMRGGAQAMNALLARSGVDWVGTPMDLVVQAQAKNQKVQMLVSTASLPFFALVAGPKSGIGAIKELKGKKVGVTNLGTTDHLMVQFVAKKEGVDPSGVEFVAVGPNLYDLLVKGEVDAGMVQEPALTLAQRAGAKLLVNFMSQQDAKQYLGGGYQFMGLNTRPDVLESKSETARKLIRGLVKANQWIRANPGAEIIKAAPTELVAGGDVAVFASSLDQFKADLYPAEGLLAEGDVQRVIDVQQESGALKDAAQFKAADLFTNALIKA
jgi:NitT/TauT family transport system substrate-binding protein